MTDDGAGTDARSARVCAAVCAAVQGRTPAVGDGALLAVFLDTSDRVILHVALDEGTRHVDELFLRHLIALVVEIESATVVLASVRRNGQPRRIDRVLWREMTQRLADGQSVLADLLVVGDERCWSAANRRRVVYPPSRAMSIS